MKTLAKGAAAALLAAFFGRGPVLVRERKGFVVSAAAASRCWNSCKLPM